MKKYTVTGTALLVLAMTAAPAIAGDGKGRFMKHFDTNNDGSVNMAEFNAAAAERFKSMDSDASGAISKDEFRDYMRSRKDERKQKRFARMDGNANGSIEREEYLAHARSKAERKFSRMDKDANGSVSKEEYSSCNKGKHQKKRMFTRMDENADGQVTKNESHAAWSKWFKRIDADNDQVVTADEVKAFRNRIHGKSRDRK